MVQMAADKSLFYHIGITIGETLISFILVLILGTFISMLLGGVTVPPIFLSPISLS